MFNAYIDQMATSNVYRPWAEWQQIKASLFSQEYVAIQYFFQSYSSKNTVGSLFVWFEDRCILNY